MAMINLVAVDGQTVVAHLTQSSVAAPVFNNGTFITPTGHCTVTALPGSTASRVYHAPPGTYTATVTQDGVTLATTTFTLLSGWTQTLGPYPTPA